MASKIPGACRFVSITPARGKIPRSLIRRLGPSLHTYYAPFLGTAGSQVLAIVKVANEALCIP